MEGVIVNYRRGRRTQTQNQMVILVKGIDSKEKAHALVGKTAVWTSPGKEKKELKGKISAEHGSKGALRVIFERGMPGQSIGEKVKII